jgi:hypothetical protein
VSSEAADQADLLQGFLVHKLVSSGIAGVSGLRNGRCQREVVVILARGNPEEVPRGEKCKLGETKLVPSSSPVAKNCSSFCISSGDWTVGVWERDRTG